jgi:hypothetical protein
MSSASGTQPAQDPIGGWEGEESLDTQMAHAMAPGANLVLVEAATNSDSDLLSAVTTASDLVLAAGGGEVLMDWGGRRPVTKHLVMGSSPPRGLCTSHRPATTPELNTPAFPPSCRGRRRHCSP